MEDGIYQILETNELIIHIRNEFTLEIITNLGFMFSAPSAGKCYYEILSSSTFWTPYVVVRDSSRFTDFPWTQYKGFLSIYDLKLWETYFKS